MMKHGLESQDVSAPIPSRLIQNFDSTQYTVGGTTDGHVWVGKGKTYSEPRTLGTTSLSQGVKLYTVMTANGCMGPMVYVLAADKKMNMDDGEMAVQKVRGLHAYATSHGYIVVQKTRTGSVEFFLWLYELYAKWIAKGQQEFREDNKLGDDVKVPSLITLDGELNQIKGAVDDSTLEVFTQNDIMAMKLAPSCTHKLQPCDRSSVYKCSKAKLKAAQLKFREPVDEELVQSVEKALGELGYRGKKKTVLATGIARINESVQDATTASRIRMGWIKSGSWPLDEKKMLSQCESYHDFNLESHVMTNKITKLIDLHLKNGFITEANMDALNVPKTALQIDQEDVGMCRDDLPLSRQRPRILNEPNFVEVTKERKERKRRQDEEDQALKQQRAIEKEQRAVEKKQRAEEKALEAQARQARKAKTRATKNWKRLYKEVKKVHSLTKRVWMNRNNTLDEKQFEFWMKALPRLMKSDTGRVKLRKRREQVGKHEAKREIAMKHYAGKKRPKSDEWFCNGCEMPYQGFQAQKLGTKAKKFRQCETCDKTWCPDCKSADKVVEHEVQCFPEENEKRKSSKRQRRR